MREAALGVWREAIDNEIMIKHISLEQSSALFKWRRKKSSGSRRDSIAHRRETQILARAVM